MPTPKRSLQEVQSASPIYRWRLNRFASAWGYYPTHMPDAYIRAISAHYYAMISLMDEAIGRVLRRLDELHLTHKTIVIFTTDHGEHLGDHWLIYKAQHYDELFHLPFLCRFPGRMGEGKRLPGFHSFVEIAPTLLQLAAVKIPAGMQGHSFAEALSGGAEHPRLAVLIQDDDPGTPEYWRTIHTDRYRFTLIGGNLERYGLPVPTGEMFDLREDPSEFRNLFDDPKHRGLRGELAEQLADFTFREYDPRSLKTANT